MGPLEFGDISLNKHWCRLRSDRSDDVYPSVVSPTSEVSKP